MDHDAVGPHTNYRPANRHKKYCVQQRTSEMLYDDGQAVSTIHGPSDQSYSDPSIDLYPPPNISVSVRSRGLTELPPALPPSARVQYSKGGWGDCVAQAHHTPHPHICTLSFPTHALQAQIRLPTHAQKATTTNPDTRTPAAKDGRPLRRPASTAAGRLESPPRSPHRKRFF